ncbi:phosphotriesterase-related protein [Streptomyces sp. DH37]|uniref:phosphotriesterase family protein n=1 Tax=Streptomyces sp. DH37 TaxID=3040122 RepID=UPI0024432B53|nr:phosphotriesterase-related protein [Streptomyces sp. DH37]MDG9702860.1 phosphotriesterase-related protein [Streptomyces sp. DH37]
MIQVNTALGPVDTAALGRASVPEHIPALTADVRANHPEEWGSEEERVADAVEKPRALAASGVRAIVGPTVVGLGRYVPRVLRTAERVPEPNIVVATGPYTYDDVSFFFRRRGPALNQAPGAEVPDPVVEMFVRDVTEGVADTGVRVGMLTCAIDEQGMTAGVERVMRAVAAAHHRTGVPVTARTHPGSRTGLEVRRVLCEEGGVDPCRVVLGHSGDTADCDHLAELADAACSIDWIAPDVMAFLPQWHHLRIGQEALPCVRERGVTEERITAMLTGNPRRLFGTADGPAGSGG